MTIDTLHTFWKSKFEGRAPADAWLRLFAVTWADRENDWLYLMCVSTCAGPFETEDRRAAFMAIALWNSRFIGADVYGALPYDLIQRGQVHWKGGTCRME